MGIAQPQARHTGDSRSAGARCESDGIAIASSVTRPVRATRSCSTTPTTSHASPLPALITLETQAACCSGIMAHPKKQAATRRNAKLKGVSQARPPHERAGARAPLTCLQAGQRTLFDLFPPKLSATRPASPISETASIAGGGIEDAQSSDLEVVGAVETSSSPVPTDADALSDATNEGLDAESESPLRGFVSSQGQA